MNDTELAGKHDCGDCGDRVTISSGSQKCAECKIPLHHNCGNESASGKRCFKCTSKVSIIEENVKNSNALSLFCRRLEMRLIPIRKDQERIPNPFETTTRREKKLPPQKTGKRVDFLNNLPPTSTKMPRMLTLWRYPPILALFGVLETHALPKIHCAVLGSFVSSKVVVEP